MTAKTEEEVDKDLDLEATQRDTEDIRKYYL